MARIPTREAGAQGLSAKATMPGVAGFNSDKLYNEVKTTLANESAKLEARVKAVTDFDNDIDNGNLNLQTEKVNTILMSEWESDPEYKNVDEYKKKVNDYYDGIDYTVFKGKDFTNKIKAENELKRKLAIDTLTIGWGVKKKKALAYTNAKQLDVKKEAILKEMQPSARKSMLKDLIKWSSETAAKGQFPEDVTIDVIGDFVNNIDYNQLKNFIDKGDLEGATKVYEREGVNFGTKTNSANKKFKALKKEKKNQEESASAELHITTFNEELGKIKKDPESVSLIELEDMVISNTLSEPLRVDLERYRKRKMNDGYGSGDIDANRFITDQISDLVSDLKNKKKVDIEAEGLKIADFIESSKDLNKKQYEGLRSKLTTITASEITDELYEERNGYINRFKVGMDAVWDSVAPGGKDFKQSATLIRDSLDKTIGRAEKISDMDEAYKYATKQLYKALYPSIGEKDNLPAKIIDGGNIVETNNGVDSGNKFDNNTMTQMTRNGVLRAFKNEYATAAGADGWEKINAE